MFFPNTKRINARLVALQKSGLNHARKSVGARQCQQLAQQKAISHGKNSFFKLVTTEISLCSYSGYLCRKVLYLSLVCVWDTVNQSAYHFY